MANVIDYLDFRGDIPFDMFPLNEVDALMLSNIAYVDFGEIVPAPSCGEISFWEAAGLLYQWKSEEIEQDRSFVSYAPELFRRMAETKRFSDMSLKNYVNIVDAERQMQFSAVTIGLSDELDFVAFRGTDDTIVGWKEDFNLCWQVVPAEAEAVSYLNDVFKQDRRVFIGGHSKGAHLAAYAASGLDKDMRDKLDRIYLFDGPGFSEEFINSEKYRQIRQYISSYIPEGSIVGVMFGHDVEPVIVGSTAKGTMQHNPLSWEVKGTSFVYRDNRLDYSIMFENAFNTWIDELPLDERKPFIDDLFSILEASGETTLSGMQTMGIAGVNACLKKMRELSPATREIVSNLLSQMGFQMKEKLNKRLKA